MWKKTKKRIPIKTDRKDDLNGIKNVNAYIRFVRWIASPIPLRTPKTQEELAVEIGIDDDTFANWKRREGFWDRVLEETKHWGKDKTATVLLSLYQKAITDGDAARVKLWLQYINDWVEKQDVAVSGTLGQLLDEIANRNQPLVHDKNKHPFGTNQRGGTAGKDKGQKVAPKQSVLDQG